VSTKSGQAHYYDVLLHRYPGGKKESGAGKEIACTNPLTWKADEAPGERAAHLGGVRFALEAGAPPKPDAALVDAQCRDGRWLFISAPEPKAYREILIGPDMYHVYDYSLFYVNIRQNAQTRVKAFLDRAAAQPAP
jgi:hypothetical protein